MELSEDEKKMIAAFRELHATPKVENADELVHYMKHFGDETKETKTSHQVPRLSIFYGEVGKGEVSFQTWKYELKCLIKEKFHSDELILQGIRRSCKGEAADLLRRTGESAKVADILHIFESTFGVIETPESIMKKLYACTQQQNESIALYSSKVEDLFLKAVEMGALEEDGRKQKLRSILYQGLTPELKQWAKFEYRTIEDYEEFKVALRKVENDMSTNKQTEFKGKCNAINKKEEGSPDSTPVKELLEKLNAKIDRLEQEMKQQQQIPIQQQHVPIQQQQQQQVPFQQQQSQGQQRYQQQQQGFQHRPQFYQDRQYDQQQQGFQHRPQFYQDRQYDQQQQGFQHRPQYYQDRQYDQQQYSETSEQQQQYYQPQQLRGNIGFRGPRHNRGSRYRGLGPRPSRGQGRGPNQYTPRRPISANNFQPQCYNCMGRGHLARNCPSLNY